MNESIAKLSAALVAASAEMPAVPFDATNPFLHNRFASLGAVIATARPILAKHGLAIMQFACSDASGRVGVRTRLVHSSGEYLEETLCLDVAEEKGKSRAQAAGSIITYLRRYAQSAMLNLYADEDSDGGPTSPPAGGSTHRAADRTSTPASTPKASIKAPRVDGASTGAAGVGQGSAPSTAPVPSHADKCKARFLEIIKEKGLEPEAWLYARNNAWILPTERLEDANADKFPTCHKVAEAILASMTAIGDALAQSGGMSQEESEAYEAAHLPQEEFNLDKRKDEPWRSMLIPTWSKHFKEDGHKTFGELSKEQLWWWAVQWKPTGYKGKPPKAEDVKLRAELDKVRDAYGFTEAKQ